MSLYIGIGAGVAAIRLFRADHKDTTWAVAQAMTDMLWWPLVLIVFLLRRLTAQTSS